MPICVASNLSQERRGFSHFLTYIVSEIELHCLKITGLLQYDNFTNSQHLLIIFLRRETLFSSQLIW